MGDAHAAGVRGQATPHWGHGDIAPRDSDVPERPDPPAMGTARLRVSPRCPRGSPRCPHRGRPRTQCPHVTTRLLPEPPRGAGGAQGGIPRGVPVSPRVEAQRRHRALQAPPGQRPTELGAVGDVATGPTGGDVLQGGPRHVGVEAEESVGGGSQGLDLLEATWRGTSGGQGAQGGLPQTPPGETEAWEPFPTPNKSPGGSHPTARGGRDDPPIPTWGN